MTSLRSGVKLILMKKLLVIIVLGLFWGNVSFADVNRYANEYKIASSEPGSPSEGDMWMDTTNNVFKVHNGTAFATVTDGQSAAEVTAEATAQAISMAIALG